MNIEENKHLSETKAHICIIGLGYVGLPLAIEFANEYDVIGFDINSSRIDELNDFIDNSGEVSEDALINAKRLTLVDDIAKTTQANTYIVTVPTPVDQDNSPDFRLLISASELVGSVLEKNNVVIYESTVYPGATEEICVPILEKESRLKFNEEFFVGYSPERINPGDNSKNLKDIVKITSGSNPEISKLIDELYQSIISAGTHSVSSIRVAEAAKVIENIQRDVNIAFFNELAMLFDTIDLDSKEVFDAASSKWNFIRFEPGLVGGHCIGVDPYYLMHKAKSVEFNPEMILAGRNTNNYLPRFVADKVFKKLEEKQNVNQPYKVLIMGATFKEDCKDIRNSKSFDLREHLIKLGIEVDISDDIADSSEVEKFYGFKLKEPHVNEEYDAIILAIKHDYILQMEIGDIRKYGTTECLIYDLKSIFPRDLVDISL
tara:strand:- start:1586 stop:2884 length:1299 start_codon:yes stop_codon:yes gene_type:complete